jgi:hypothetical protein
MITEQLQRYLKPAEIVKEYYTTFYGLYQGEKLGELHPLKTYGGHRRFLREEIEKLFPKRY